MNADIRKAVFASVHLCAVTCAFCGHADTLEAFTSTPVSGSTAADVFQCPACRRAVKRVLGRDRWQMPAVELQEIGGAL